MMIVFEHRTESYTMKLVKLLVNRKIIPSQILPIVKTSLQFKWN
jgi:hypothetical protein